MLSFTSELKDLEHISKVYCWSGHISRSSSKCYIVFPKSKLFFVKVSIKNAYFWRVWGADRSAPCSQRNVFLFKPLMLRIHYNIKIFELLQNCAFFKSYFLERSHKSKMNRGRKHLFFAPSAIQTEFLVTWGLGLR